MNSVLCHLFSYTGIPSLARLLFARRARFVVMFHGISARRHDHIPRDAQPYLSSSELDLVLKWIKSHFAFLSPQEFLQAEKPGILVTFDDGFANNVTNALPVLERHHAQAIFFVTTQHVLNPRNWLPATRRTALKRWQTELDVEEDLAIDFFDGMNTDQLRLCADHPLVTIGSHTLSHPWLTRSDPTALALELRESKRLLESLTQKPVDFFAYPSGDYDRPVMEAVQSAGYRAAFAADTQYLGSPLFEIPRIGLYDADPVYLGLKLSGFHRSALILEGGR